MFFNRVNGKSQLEVTFVLIEGICEGLIFPISGYHIIVLKFSRIRMID